MMSFSQEARVPVWLRPIAMVCVALFLAEVVVGILDAWHSHSLFALIDADRDRFFLETALSSHFAEAATIASIDRALVLAIALVFVPLFVALYSRLKAPRRPPRWAWLGWFVPLIQLYMPFRLAREIDANALGTRPSKTTASWTLFLWWVLWLVSRLSGLLSYVTFQNAELERATWFSLLAATTSAGAALCGAWLVYRWALRTGPGVLR